VRKAYPLCPMCHESMNPVLYQKVSGVVLHRCATCGAWLDGTNADKFLLLFEAGRMAEFEQRAVRAGTEDLEARVAKLEKQQDFRPPSQAMSEPGFPPSSSSAVSDVLDLLGFLSSLF
jgi:Zn-finger nucleic acid-binding protein